MASPIKWDDTERMREQLELDYDGIEDNVELVTERARENGLDVEDFIEHYLTNFVINRFGILAASPAIKRMTVEVAGYLEIGFMLGREYERENRDNGQ